MTSKFFGRKISTQFRSTSLSSSASSLSSASPSSPHSQHSVKETSVIVKSVDPQSGQKMINKYLVVRELGRGVHGKVKLCVDSLTNVHYALKIIPKNKSRKFGKMSSNDLEKIKREIAIMKKCAHPNVVQLFEVIDDPSQEKIYLEYVDGGELTWKDDADQPVIPLSTIKSHLLQLIVGLEYLHYQGIIHRDIKPQNILVDSAGIVAKIADFGVSFFSERLQTSDTTDDVELGKTAGSPAFFAPELCIYDSNSFDKLNQGNEGEEELTPIADESTRKELSFSGSPSTPIPMLESSVPSSDKLDNRALLDPVAPKFSIGLDSQLSALFEATTEDDDDDKDPLASSSAKPLTVGKSIDIWALGVTLYCMVYGRLPFIAQTEYELFSLIPKQPITFPVDTNRGDLTQIEPQLIDIILKLLEKDPKLRISLHDAKYHPWLHDGVPGATDQEKKEWLDNSDPKLFGLRQMEQDPNNAGRYDDKGRIKVSDSEVKSAVTVGVVFRKMVEAFKRRLSKGVSWMSPTSPASATTEEKSRWGWRRRSSALFHSTSNQSLRRDSTVSTTNSDVSSAGPFSPVFQQLPTVSSAHEPSTADNLPDPTALHRRSASVPINFESKDSLASGQGEAPIDEESSVNLRKHAIAQSRSRK